MKASRRDYQEIVRLIRRMEKGTTRRLMWGHGMAQILKKSNTTFDEERFVSACGADDENNVVDFAEKVKPK